MSREDVHPESGGHEVVFTAGKARLLKQTSGQAHNWRHIEFSTIGQGPCYGPDQSRNSHVAKVPSDSRVCTSAVGTTPKCAFQKRCQNLAKKHVWRLL